MILEYTITCKGTPALGTGCGFCPNCKEWFSKQPDPAKAEEQYTRNRRYPKILNQLQGEKSVEDLLKRFKEIHSELARYEELFGVGSDLAEKYCGNNQANLGRAQECLTVAKFAINNLIGYGP
jgi:uncharacterized Zn finger protein (UPF0148 family)